MKTLKNTFALAAILLGFAFSANAQTGVSASAATSATIITPIAISKTADMSFGNIAINNNAGTVVLAPAGTRSATGGVTLPSTTGSISAASFSVTGASGYTFSITLPSSVTLTGSESGSMVVNSFTSTPSSSGTLSGGAATVLVGATLNLEASQAAGTYTNASDLVVTVNYN